MNTKKSSLVFGGVLIAIGVLNLLANLDIFYLESETVVSLFFGAGGLIFLLLFLQRNSFGYLIVASILIFIALAVFLTNLRVFDDEYIGVIFLWGMAALFTVGYLRNRNSWGLLIPAGLLITIGVMVALNTTLYIYDEVLASIFFLGFGLTFGVLYLLRNESNKLHWAKVPAIGLTAFSLFIYLVTEDSFIVDLMFPLALILIGGYLVYASTKNRAVSQANGT